MSLSLSDFSAAYHINMELAVEMVEAIRNDWTNPHHLNSGDSDSDLSVRQHIRELLISPLWEAICSTIKNYTHEELGLVLWHQLLDIPGTIKKDKGRHSYKLTYCHECCIQRWVRISNKELRNPYCRKCSALRAHRRRRNV